MCGITGVAGLVTIKEEQALRTLLVLDSIRGEDSTGIAAIDIDNNTHVVKRVGDPFYLLNSTDYRKALTKNHRAIIGHNRYATVGGNPTEETAHPFEFETLVGVHNGTLIGKYRLDDAHKYKVDSENLYAHMDKHGLKDALDKVEGAWSLVWWDKFEETLNFLRNDKRPMWIAGSVDRMSMFFASEAWMINVSCNKAGILIDPPFLTEVDMHMSFKIGKNRKIEKPHVIPSPQTYVAPVYVNNYSRGHGQQGGFFPKKEIVLSPAGTGVTHSKAEIIEAKRSKLSLVAKAIVNEKPIPAGVVASYVNPKERRFEIMGARIDEKGARFVSLMDVVEPEHPVRLYLRKQDNYVNFIGRELTGNVSGFVNNANGEYFKVSPHGAKLVPLSSYIDKKIKDEDENLLLYMGAGRKLFTKKEWSAKYSTCCNCFDRVFPDDTGNRITPDGECICGNCCANLPVEYNGVKLVAVI